MHYLYHRKPKDLQGTTLYPLNALKDVFPDAYAFQAKKYAGREFIMQQRIPFLDCLWNDVLHFSAVHPQKILEALREAGDSLDGISHKFFEIDPELLEPEKTIVFLYDGLDRINKMKKENFASYDPTEVSKYDILPDETRRYYADMISQNKRPLSFHGVPHILYKGNLDIKKLNISTMRING